MNNPTTATEPGSFAEALADIRLLPQRVATSTSALLRQHGWRHTHLTPAHVWLWSKRLPDGRTLLTLFTEHNNEVACPAFYCPRQFRKSENADA